MQSLDWYVHRLKSMSVGEIAWRVRNMLSANLDLVRIPLGLYPKLSNRDRLTLESFQPGFSCIDAEAASNTDFGEQPFLEWRQRAIRDADLVMQDKLSFFDLEEQHLGDPIDWQMDWSANLAGPLRQSHLTDYRNFEEFGDCKLVWEPNRHHHLVILARAWRMTGDERYARKVVSILMHWIEANPFGYGMNWKSPLEVGVRLINWVWAIDMIRDANVFSDSEWDSVVDTVYLAIWDTQRKFSQGSSANNHLVGEVAGVFVASCYFDALPKAAKWRDESYAILDYELIAQSFSDGCTREHAFNYQFFVLQFYAYSQIAGERSGFAVTDAYRKRLQQMYHFMAELIADTGHPPNMGDADDGYVLDLGDKPRNARQLVSVGGVLFNDRELLMAPAVESVYWLFGNVIDSQQVLETPHLSHGYKESGYFVLRSDKERCPRKVRVFFDCAELGYGSIAAHGHADCLSFSLAVDGHDVFVDPGTYDYYSHPDWRNFMRSTPAHNTLCVDGESQSELLGRFLWGARAEATQLDWQDDDSSSSISGSHDGYTRLADPVTHQRTLTLDKSNGNVRILDTVDATGKHSIALYFHLSAGSRLSELEEGVLIESGDCEMSLTCSHGELRISEANAQEMMSWVSDGYHRKAAACSVILEAETDGKTEFETRLKLLN